MCITRKGKRKCLLAYHFTEVTRDESSDDSFLLSSFLIVHFERWIKTNICTGYLREENDSFESINGDDSSSTFLEQYYF